MKAIISSTFDDRYLYFLPITTFLWNKLNVDVICFMPQWVHFDDSNKVLEKGKIIKLVQDTIMEQQLKCMAVYFDAPEHKEATYAQCSRLYGACLDLPEDEILISSDIDMGVFQAIKTNIDYSINQWGGTMTVFGRDLVPNGQIPMCYVWGSVINWRRAFKLCEVSMIDGVPPSTISGTLKTYQQCLDSLLGHIECESFRGNYWAKDQEEMFDKMQYTSKVEINRSNGQNQFAQHRVDRTDLHYKDRLDPYNLIDAHLWRPGYSEENFPKILELMQYMYPEDNFDWLISYNEAYKKLL